jgi:hypothetical protein
MVDGNQAKPAAARSPAPRSDAAWTNAAFMLFKTDGVEPLPIDIDVASDGRDMPDAKLEALCDVIFGTLGGSDGRPVGDSKP